LDLRKLRLLSELARRDTIAEVARTVGYSSSAVSQSLSQLEAEVGVQLLERDGRRVRLTPAARSLVGRVDRVLAELDAAEVELASEQQTVRGEVVIGSFPSAAAGLVVPALADLTHRYPDVACSVREHEPADGIALLRSGVLDVLVSESYRGLAPRSTGGLVSQLLLEEPLRLLLPAAHARPRRSVRLSDLREAAWISGLAATPFATAVERACRLAGFTPRIAHRADDAVLIHALVAAGAGVALLPALACREVDAVRIASVSPDPPRRRISALVRRGADRRPSVAATLGALERQAARLTGA